MSVLEVQDLGIAFGGIRAVHDVSFKVSAGEIVSIIGPNGAGKTTLFNMISGIYRPAKGQVMLDGIDVTSMEPFQLARRGMSRSFQNLQIFQNMTVLENAMVGFHLEEQGSILSDLFNLSSSRKRALRAKKEAYGLLERVGLARAADRDATSLSYGSLKRLEIARALALKPKVLLLDEPAAGCNAVETEEIDNLIAEVADSGIAVLLVEHDMKMVMRISNHIVVLDQGEKIAEGRPERICKDPAVIAAYLGTESARGVH